MYIQVSHTCFPLSVNGSIQRQTHIGAIHADETHFKVWMLADAHTGYVSSFEIYTGKKGDVEKGLGASVVKTLCQPVDIRYLCYLKN